MKPLAKHLGGHKNITHTDAGSLEYLTGRFNIKTMIDVGCGPGGQVSLAESAFGLNATGIDGDDTIERACQWIKHDYADCPLRLYSVPGGDLLNIEPPVFDLGWSVEFLEHVDARYEANYMSTFAKCRVVLVTSPPPGTPGHHHVNCQETWYWFRLFAKWGFYLDIEASAGVRRMSTMRRDFVRDTGLVFVNKELPSA